MSDQETRQRVLEAAGPVFAREGFEAARVRTIAQRAGTAPAAVNYHFRSKEQLYIETVRYAAEVCLRRSPLPVWPDGVSAETRLKDFLRCFLPRFLGEDLPTWPVHLIMRELAQPTGEATAQFVREFVQPTFEVLKHILVEFVPALPTEKLILLASSIIGQCLHYHHARHVLPLLIGDEEYRGYRVEQLTEHIYAFTLAALRGLYPPGSAQESE